MNQTKDNKIIINLKLSNELDEFDITNTYFEKILAPLTKNVYNICEYGLTEMINNAIEHSYGNNLTIEALNQNNEIFLSIQDDGVGIFKRIAGLLQATDHREAVLQLTKGKFTSDPNHHTGEGIFFTSRIFDEFQLIANNLCFTKSNTENDWFLKTISATQGTTVNLKIASNSPKNIIDLFVDFQDPESHEFNKTEITVALSNFGEQRYIARSQAKKILINLEKFKIITLDFKGVTMVGQGFVDEIFRIFIKHHPQIKINYINANADIIFMINRGIYEH